MSFKAAVDRINTWSVTGITTNIGLDDFPGTVSEGALPALLLLGGNYPGSKVEPFDINATYAQTVIYMTHAILLNGAALKNPQNGFYAACSLIDNYLAKVKTDWTLNSNLAKPLSIFGASFQPFTLGTVTYWAVLLRHRWELVV